MADPTPLSQLAAKAYVYGFPLVFSVEQARRYATTGVGANPAAIYNTLSHARTLAGPKDTFVSINNDTVYTMAQLDLTVGPLLFGVPDTDGEYYVAQFIDAWTDNFAYVGKRATGTHAQRYLIVPPGWEATAPDDVDDVIHAPTTLVSIILRWACASADDLPRVHALQDAVELRPLGSGPPAPAPAPAGSPDPDPAVPESLRFWEQLRLWMHAYPPAPHDVELQQAFAPLGLLQDGASPYADPDPELRAALEQGSAVGQQGLADALANVSGEQQNGWRLAYHAFDYNVDYFEIGTIDAPEWKIADRTKAIGERAAAALGGLWGNHGYEAAYALTWVDADGDQLTGERPYTMRLDPLPPVDAFWSITMYALPDFYLVDNPIDRYSIGDRTAGLVTDADGGVTITLAHTEPADATARANWLPTPSGAFRPIMRLYSPQPAVLDGTFEIPPIAKSKA